MVGLIGNRRGRLVERQLGDGSKIRLIIYLDYLFVFKRTVAGDTVKGKRKHPLLHLVRGLTLINHLVDLDITRADKRLAVNDDELVKRLAILDTDGFCADNDAGIDLVENALSKDRIVFACSIGNTNQILVLTGLSGVNPMAVGDIFMGDILTNLIAQRMIIDNFLTVGRFQQGRSRTMVYQTLILFYDTGNGRNVVGCQIRHLFLR